MHSSIYLKHILEDNVSVICGAKVLGGIKIYRALSTFKWPKI